MTTDDRMDFAYKHMWPVFNPLDYDCDVEGCDAKKGEYCDSKQKGVHAFRASDVLEKMVNERKRRR